ncbi:MAG: hypothetical protein NXI04_17490 [Planctomycetaceae bacterium]|nr:hypothetical protein [Planctomycetaceae bacterium]
MTSARSIKAGSAFVEFFLDDGRLQRGLKTVERRISRFGASIRSNGAALLGLGGVLAVPFLAGIKAASDLEETMNKFNVVFGENAEAVKQWGDNFAKEVGRSKRQIADFLAGTQDLFIPIGFDASEAEQYSKQLTQLAVDVASFNNKADADVLRDFHAALTGGGETVKKYGVILNVATTNQELLAQGIDPKSATNQQKVFARMQVLLKGTTAAQGDAIRSSGSYANQMKRLAGVTEDAAGAIGNILLPVITPVVSKIADVARWVEVAVDANKELVSAIFNVVSGVLATGVAMVALGTIIQVVTFGIGGLGKAMSLVVKGLLLVKAAITSTVGLMTALLSPAGLLIGAFAGITAYAISASGAVDSLSNFLGGRLSRTWKTIVALIGSGNLKAAGNLAMAGLKAVFSIGLAEIQGFWIRFKGELAGIFLSLTSTLENAWLDFSGVFVDSMISAAARVKSVFQSASGEISKYIAAAIAKASGQDVGEVLQTLQEDQDRNRVDPIGDAEREIAERQQQRQRRKERSEIETQEAIDLVREQTERRAEAAGEEVQKAAAEFDNAQNEAEGILANNGENDPESISNSIARLLREFNENREAAAAEVNRANTGVDVRSSQASETVAIALSGSAGRTAQDAIDDQTNALLGELEDVNGNLKKAPVVKESTT